MERVSREVRKKGYLLFRKNKVKKELETEKRIHFKVEGETDIHSVIFDKTNKNFVCDCPFFTLHEKKCSHIIACELFLKET
ncbi:MAG: hypothetical protein ACP5O8_02500 [Candidatus Aenigmatarchaeota archaeon]